MRGDQEPIDLPPYLPFSIGRCRSVVRGRPHYSVTSGQGNRELIRLEVPVTSYDVGVFPKGVHMREHFVQNAP
eukprot:4524550-Amphidinium_carterae.1